MGACDGGHGFYCLRDLAVIGIIGLGSACFCVYNFGFLYKSEDDSLTASI